MDLYQQIKDYFFPKPTVEKAISGLTVMMNELEEVVTASLAEQDAAEDIIHAQRAIQYHASREIQDARIVITNLQALVSK